MELLPSSPAMNALLRRYTRSLRVSKTIKKNKQKKPVSFQVKCIYFAFTTRHVKKITHLHKNEIEFSMYNEKNIYHRKTAERSVRLFVREREQLLQDQKDLRRS